MYKAIITHGQVASCFLEDTYREAFYREISVAYGYMLGCASSSLEKVDTKKIEPEANQKKSKNELPIYLYGATALSTVGFLTMVILYFKK